MLSEIFVENFRLRFSSQIFVWDFHLKFLSEIFVWDFHLRFSSEIFVRDFRLRLLSEIRLGGQVLHWRNQKFNLAFLPHRHDKVLWIRPFQNRQKVASSKIKIELCWQIGEQVKWNDNDSEFLTTTNNDSCCCVIKEINYCCAAVQILSLNLCITYLWIRIKPILHRQLFSNEKQGVFLV